MASWSTNSGSLEILSSMSGLFKKNDIAIQKKR